MGKAYIFGDLHGYHKNLCRGSSKWSDLSGCRDFDNEIEMTEVLVDEINSKVTENDTLISNGDFCFGSTENVRTLRSKIRCKNIIFIYGNHDHHVRSNESLQSLFTSCHDYLELRHEGTNIIICHYPIRSWNGMYRGNVHFFSHVHSKPREEYGRSMDVGFDGNDCKIYALDDVVKYLLSKPIITEGHHA